MAEAASNVILSSETSETSYLNSLNPSHKLEYTKKLVTTDGRQLPDPYTIKNWVSYEKIWPQLEWPSIYMYFIEKPCVYTKESLKVYKSLEAYNYVENGHVQKVFYCDADKDFCYLKARVMPSQRQGDKSNFYNVWVCIHKKDTFILTGNCTCMAGLGSTCSHIAALLMLVEMAVRVGMTNEAPTSRLCEWVQVKKKIEPAVLRKMSFNKPKRNIAIKKRIVKPLPIIVPIEHVELQTLSIVAPMAALFTSCEKEERPGNVSVSDVRENKELSCLIPPPITSLFYKYGDDTEVVFSNLCNGYTQEKCDKLAEMTSQQSQDSAWYEHRAGRITASKWHSVCHLRETTDPSNVLDDIMQYNCNKNLCQKKEIKWGMENENIARHQYFELQKENHNHFTVLETGLVLRPDYPFVGASPDGVVSCTCHPGKGLLEIKCPYKYRNGLTGFEKDSAFCLNSEKNLKSTHKYYTQVQAQMFVCNAAYTDFCVWTLEGCIIKRIFKDVTFIEEMLRRVTTFFKAIVLPELLSRSRDPAVDKDVLYCFCQRPEFGHMILCEDNNCPFVWFHYQCVGIRRMPQRRWLCDSCKAFSATQD